MRRWFLIATLAGGLLTAGAAHASSTAEVIRFLSVQVSQSQPNESTVVIRDNDLVRGKKVGTDTLTCKLVSQSKANCTLVIVRPAGKINAKFVLRFGAPSGAGIVTGGSGKWANAKGSFTYTNLNERGTRTNVVVTLK